MLVYRDASLDVSTSATLDRLRQLARRGDRLAFLVELGEFEQGVADALHPHRDGLCLTQTRLRTAARSAGRAYLSERTGEAARPHLDRAVAVLDALASGPLPSRIRVHPPEGYAQYALDPGGYAAAADAYRAVSDDRGAGRAIVIGVRSIGTSLSAVVAAELGTERTITVRPRGRTGERRIVAEPALTECVARWLDDGADALIVDEGPGATGETFYAVAGWLRHLGVPDERIVLLPSRVWGMPLADAARRRWFDDAPKFAPPLRDERPERIAAAHDLLELDDLSAGRWRLLVPGAGGSAARIAHERVKYRGRIGAGEHLLIRYAGLGRWGEAVVRRAAALAAEGSAPPIRDFADGFLVYGWTDGRPLGRVEAVRRPPLPAIERYLRARAGRFGTAEEVDNGPILEMLIENVAEFFGPAAPGMAAAARRLERLPPVEAVIPDARMQPREWVRAPTGVVKVDGFDHGADLRLPGPTHPAWDLAGVAIEFALPPAAVQRLAGAIAPGVGEPTDRLREAAEAYRPAYAAALLADALLSAREATTAADGRALRAEAALYRRALARELERATSAAHEPPEVIGPMPTHSEPLADRV